MRTKSIPTGLPLITLGVLFALFLLAIDLGTLTVGTDAAASAPSSAIPSSDLSASASTNVPASLRAPKAPKPTQMVGAPLAPLCGPNWSVISSPNVSTNNYLNGVAAVSATDVWAVGDYNSGTIYQTLVEHWDGSIWSVVPSSNVGTGHNYLSGVAAVSATDVWAVGSYHTATALQTLVERWDGSVWQVVPSPNVGTSHNVLYGVAVVSATDVWAVGDYANGTTYQTLVEHWDGSIWSVVPSPNVGTGHNDLYRVAAVSATDVWAVGDYNSGTAGQTLVERWDGSVWNIVPSPNVGTNDNYLNGVAVVSATDVWAVGFYYNPSGRTLVERWDGSVWNIVPSPNVGTSHNYLNGVAVVSATDVWTMGNYYTGTVNQTVVERYNPCPPSPTNTNTPLPTQTSGGPSATPMPSSTSTSPAATATTANATATPTVCSTEFSDVPPGSTFYSFVQCMACQGIINGYTSGCASGNLCFRPNNDVTRGQLAKIVSNAAGFTEPPGDRQFEDVATGSTFFDYIWRLADRGYIGGYPCGGTGEPCGVGNLPYFRPNANASRGQISKIVSNSARFGDPAGAQIFEDVSPTSTFYNYIQRLANRGVMSGYTCGGQGEPCNPPGSRPYFRQGNNATRGQTSKIVSNTFFPNCQTPSNR